MSFEGLDHSVLLPSLPIFPLPNLVFFPHTLLPLHVFEPRYLALVEAVLATDRKMGIVQLQEGWQSDYYGQPAIHVVLGVGEIVQDLTDDDDTRNILVRGLGRARVLDEAPTEDPFRVVRAEPLPDRWEERDREGIGLQLLTLRQLFAGVVVGTPGAEIESALALFQPDADPSRVIDSISSATPLTPDQRQTLLGEDRVLHRAERLIEMLAERVRVPGG